MSPDGAPQEALVAKCIQSAFFSVALTCGKHKRQVSRFTGVEKASFQRDQQGIRNTYPHKPRSADGISGLNDRDSFCRGSDLLRMLRLAIGPRQSGLVLTNLADQPRREELYSFTLRLVDFRVRRREMPDACP